LHGYHHRQRNPGQREDAGERLRSPGAQEQLLVAGRNRKSAEVETLDHTGGGFYQGFVKFGPPVKGVRVVNEKYLLQTLQSRQGDTSISAIIWTNRERLEPSDWAGTDASPTNYKTGHVLPEMWQENGYENRQRRPQSSWHSVLGVFGLSRM
jgi:hypothetical protein